MPILNIETRHYGFVRGSSPFPNFVSKKILVEGDSWAAHPIVGGSLNNQIEELGENDFGILDIAQPGDEASKMLKPGTRQRRKLDSLTTNELYLSVFDMIFLSAGGNDIIGEELLGFVDRKVENPSKYGHKLINGKFNGAVSDVVLWYKDFLDSLVGTPNEYAKVVTHCYSYLTPRPVSLPIPPFGIQFGNGEIYRHLHGQGITDVDEMYDIVIYMLRYFRDQMKTLEDDHDNFVISDTLEVLLGPDGKPDMSLWYDEVHPNSKGFRLVATKIREDARARGCWPD
ncbi:hypothetical protein [Candidatus Thiosymbion oneisti]|uniref:hypothetical protein n=1 Tax=Candidatus Thiosymbion oneisti TaxID=589554 RepID=UPI0010618FE1|nr:hypothetical protein [Candidatus Thiosymbion oneisti]